MVFSLSPTGLASTTPALLGDATDNVIYPQQHDGALYRCLDGLHLHSASKMAPEHALKAIDSNAALACWLHQYMQSRSHATRSGGLAVGTLFVG